MSEQLLILLLPLAAWSGWWVGTRKELRVERQNKNRAAYFEGLNYLLNDQTKQAIQVFMDVVEMDRQTLETQLTLGSLFRKRGELDRALLIHKNLFERENISDDVRPKLCFELAEDYYQAGMLADSRATFESLLEHNTQRREVMARLLDVYTQQRDWAQAVRLAEQWQASGYGSRAVEMAQFCCEMAEAAHAAGDANAAQAHVLRAREIDKECVRANMILGQLAEEDGRAVEAVHHYQSIEQQNPVFLQEVLEALQRNYHALGRDDEFMNYLMQMQERHPWARLALKYAECVHERQGRRAAYDYLIERFKRHPGPSLLQALLRYGDVDQEVVRLTEPCQTFLQPQVHYRCRQCGFSQQALTWHCPSCKSWSTFYPLSELRFIEK